MTTTAVAPQPVAEDEGDLAPLEMEHPEDQAPAAAGTDPCASCATTPCVFCRANELLIGYGITDVIITRSL